MARSDSIRVTRPVAVRRFVTALALAAASAVTLAEAPPGISLLTREFEAFDNKSLAQQVQELADREEIRELIARYAHRVAHRQPFSDLFTDDGVYRSHPSPGSVRETRGRSNLAARFDSNPQSAESALPMIHNFLISISGDDAIGICANELRITQNGTSIIASGYYQDRYRRVNGRWKFAERDITWFHWAPLQEGWSRPGTAN